MTATEESPVSHHFDSPTAIEDGRINLCDVFVFPGEPGTTVLILTVNPDAGLSSPATLRPEAVHEFAIATDGGVVADLALRVRVDEPDARGVQSVRVLRAEGDELADAAAGRPLGSGRTGALLELDLGRGLPPGRAWAGLSADPFSADGAALAGFLQAAGQGRWAPELFDGGSDLFAGRDVTAVALQVPDALLGDGRVSVWGQITLVGHAPPRRVSRMGQPMLRPLFFPVPGSDTEELNAGDPTTDRDRYRERVTAAVDRLRDLAGGDRAAAAVVADAFLPDVLRYRAGERSGWSPGRDAGRGLGDDVFAAALLAVTGRPLGTRTPPAAPQAAFPHLSAPHRSELPPLAELFGLRTAPPASG